MTADGAPSPGARLLPAARPRWWWSFGPCGEACVLTGLCPNPGAPHQARGEAPRRDAQPAKAQSAWRYPTFWRSRNSFLPKQQALGLFETSRKRHFLLGSAGVQGEGGWGPSGQTGKPGGRGPRLNDPQDGSRGGGPKQAAGGSRCERHCRPASCNETLVRKGLRGSASADNTCLSLGPRRPPSGAATRQEAPRKASSPHRLSARLPLRSLRPPACRLAGSKQPGPRGAGGPQTRGSGVSWNKLVNTAPSERLR